MNTFMMEKIVIAYGKRKRVLFYITAAVRLKRPNDVFLKVQGVLVELL